MGLSSAVPSRLGAPSPWIPGGGSRQGPRCPHGAFKKPTTSSRNTSSRSQWETCGLGSEERRAGGGKEEGGEKQPGIKPKFWRGRGDGEEQGGGV